MARVATFVQWVANAGVTRQYLAYRVFSRTQVFNAGGSDVSNGIWVVLAIILAIVIYVIAKVVYYARLSRKQWQEVDRSKLREWQDDDEW